MFLERNCLFLVLILSPKCTSIPYRPLQRSARLRFSFTCRAACFIISISAGVVFFFSEGYRLAINILTASKLQPRNMSILIGDANSGHDIMSWLLGVASFCFLPVCTAQHPAYHSAGANGIFLVDHREAYLQHMVPPFGSCSRTILGSCKWRSLLVACNGGETPYMVMATVPDIRSQDPGDAQHSAVLRPSRICRHLQHEIECQTESLLYGFEAKNERKYDLKHHRHRRTCL